MDKRPTYLELLRNPQWQRKRLEVLQRFDFACENCGRKDSELHVHHLYYERGKLPWEYPTESLQALCASCHRKAQDLLTLFKRQMGLVGWDLSQLLGYAVGIESDREREKPFEVLDYEMAQGIGDYWGLSPETVIANLKATRITGAALHTLALAAGKRRF